MDESSLRELARLSQPFYTYADADHIANVRRGTSRRWIAGYRYWSSDRELVIHPPLIRRPDSLINNGVSFVDLIEIVAVGKLKASGFSLSTIRSLVRLFQAQLGAERPFVTLKFKTSFFDILVVHGPAVLHIPRPEHTKMLAISGALSPYLQGLDYEHDIVHRWWPLGRGHGIVVDPDVGFGFPVIAGSGVRTDIILERIRVGELPDQIAEDFRITPLDVIHAVQFETDRLAA